MAADVKLRGRFPIQRLVPDSDVRYVIVMFLAELLDLPERFFSDGVASHPPVDFTDLTDFTKGIFKIQFHLVNVSDTDIR